MSISRQYCVVSGQQVKITSEPFPVHTAEQLRQVVWRQIGPITQEQVYCVSDSTATELRFVCVDCQQKNITDLASVLNNAQDMSASAGFPVRF